VRWIDGIINSKHEKESRPMVVPLNYIFQEQSNYVPYISLILGVWVGYLDFDFEAFNGKIPVVRLFVIDTDIYVY